MDRGLEFLVLLFCVAIFVAWLRGRMRSRLDAPVPSIFPSPALAIEPISILEVIPGKLRVRVFKHEITLPRGFEHHIEEHQVIHYGSPVQCCTYLTEGFLAYGHKEIRFTLHPTTEKHTTDFERGFISLVKGIVQFSEKGHIADAGGLSQFAPPGFFGNRNILGIGYTEPQGILGIDTPAPTLEAIILKGDEMEAAKKYGLTRVLSQIGLAYRFYPHPFWADLDRDCIVNLASMEKSLLGQIARMSTRVRYLAQGERISLMVLSRAHEKLRGFLEALPNTASVALLTERHPCANALLVWEPERKTPAAIMLPNSDASRKSGAFLAFVPEQRENEIRLVEDGHAILLKSPVWNEIRNALITGKELYLPFGEGGARSLQVEWGGRLVRNQIDGQMYAPELILRFVCPETASRASGLVQMAEYALLTDDHEISERMHEGQIGGCITSVQSAVEKCFASFFSNQPQNLIVQVELLPGRRRRIGTSGSAGLAEETLDKLRQQLTAIPFPEVVLGPVKFQCFFRIWGSSQKPS